jgi:hypothetical protein
MHVVAAIDGVETDRRVVHERGNAAGLAAELSITFMQNDGPMQRPQMANRSGPR